MLKLRNGEAVKPEVQRGNSIFCMFNYIRFSSLPLTCWNKAKIS